MPPANHIHLVKYFWDIRSQAGIVDNIVSMSTIRDWQDHTGITLERWERDAVFEMDRAFRSAHYNVVKYHADIDRRNEERKNKRGRR